MKSSKTRPRARHSGLCSPFEELAALLKRKSFKLTPFCDKHRAAIPDNVRSLPETADEAELFRLAMADVRPMVQQKKMAGPSARAVSESGAGDEDARVLARLNNLVRCGKGFMVSDTPEYVEGTGYDINPAVARRLHRGDFSIQGHIDLHGLGVCEARRVFDRFLAAAVKTGKRAVLVVHGRGLSSPKQPVLKTSVSRWLTRGPWRKWTIAFCSARSYDGGAGATYVLLRTRPVTKRYRKRPPR